MNHGSIGLVRDQARKNQVEDFTAANLDGIGRDKCVLRLGAVSRDDTGAALARAAFVFTSTLSGVAAAAFIWFVRAATFVEKKRVCVVSRRERRLLLLL